MALCRFSAPPTLPAFIYAADSGNKIAFITGSNRINAKHLTMNSEIKVLGEGKFLRLVSKNSWEYVERRNVSAIVAIIAEHEGNVILVEQYRTAAGARVIEFPAGLAGDIPGREDEKIQEAAIRELEEETGFTAEKLIYLCEGPATAGASSEIITFFKAIGTRKVSQGGGDSTENIIVHLVPFDNIEKWLAERKAEGMVIDLKVYTGLYFLLKDHCPKTEAK